jgi:pilus assembly protein Flp/PilA
MATMLADIAALLRLLKSDRRGVTALEYGLIASLIAVAIITSVANAGVKLAATFNSVSSHL